MSWTVLGDVVNVGAIISFSAGGVAVNGYNKYVATSPSESLLELCQQDLEKIKKRLKALTPRQREEIYVLSNSKDSKCKGLEEIELVHLRLLDNVDELCEKCSESSFLQRRLPSSQLVVDIKNLRQQVVTLQKDTWNTTTSRNEANRLAGARREHVEHQPSLPSPSPTTDSRRQSTNAQSSTIEPGEYQSDIVYPPTGYTAARSGGIRLPPGLGGDWLEVLTISSPTIMGIVHECRVADKDGEIGQLAGVWVKANLRYYPTDGFRGPAMETSPPQWEIVSVTKLFHSTTDAQHQAELEPLMNIMIPTRLGDKLGTSNFKLAATGLGTCQWKWPASYQRLGPVFGHDPNRDSRHSRQGDRHNQTV
ncbi:hypothetical protein H4582DRAFT_2067164 [Lactarius indigo]|nr:hypothetical protein H4582DRAFT_2067164 [Lactarius indigo]